MAALKELDADSFSSSVAEGKVVVDFYTERCPPCRQMAPLLETLAQEFSDSVHMYKVDAGLNMKLAAEFGIRAVPTFLLFQDGEKVKQVSGAQSREQFISWME